MGVHHTLYAIYWNCKPFSLMNMQSIFIEMNSLQIYQCMDGVVSVFLLQCVFRFSARLNLSPAHIVTSAVICFNMGTETVDFE